MCFASLKITMSVIQTPVDPLLSVQEMEAVFVLLGILYPQFTNPHQIHLVVLVRKCIPSEL